MVAAAGFAALCVLVLTKSAVMLEPDDHAYQASIVGVSQGHLLLTTAQYHGLSRLLGDGGTSIPQWVHLADGRWISQKNPGYPFLAVPFYALGALRLAPLFYGAVASVALFVGARRWLGAWGGTIAVLLYCTSGAAITFAWRPTMESFTDASLVATGAGLLLWTMLAIEASTRRRFLTGLGGFVALGAATLTRYTDVLELAVAVAAVLALGGRQQLSRLVVAGWMAVVVAFGAFVVAFDTVVYGSPLKTGYAPGLITFSLSAIWPNLVHMPARLVAAMPVAVVAAVAVAWIAARLLAPRSPAPEVGTERADRRRDAVVALTLTGGWLVIWGLYLAYDWTVTQFGDDPVHVVRFYLPALGLVALLGAWTLARLPVMVWVAAVVALLGAGIASFHVLSAAGGHGLGPGSGPRGGRALPGGPPRGRGLLPGPAGANRAPSEPGH